MSYSYSSYSSGGYGGDAFSQADLNQDGRVDLGEFENFVGSNLGANTALVGGGGVYGGGVYGAGAYGGGVYDAGASYVSGGLYGAGAYGAGAYGAGAYGAGAYGAGVYDAGAAYVGGGAYDASTAVVSGGVYNTGLATSVQYATDSQGLYQDPNPTIIRRPAAGGVATYTQNIRLRFLQPPPVPPHGPLIIREVRPPQPPPPPPLHITQRAPPPPIPPPLVLRERPPIPPVPLPTQLRTQLLPPIPVPPRSVVIERLPPLPPRPRDVIIDRWLPYAGLAKRRTLLQRAGAAHRYAAPRNVVIQYDAAPARIVRQFQNLGVTQYSPAAYVQQYGASLLDSGTLVSQARAAGVVEDITAHGYVGSAGYGYGYGGATYGQAGLVGGADYLGVGGGYYGGGVTGWEGGYGGSVSGFEGGYVGGAGGWGGSYYGGGLTGWGGAVGTGSLVGNLAHAAFSAGDLNASGTLNRGEFNNLVTGGGIDANLATPY